MTGSKGRLPACHHFCQRQGANSLIQAQTQISPFHNRLPLRSHAISLFIQLIERRQIEISNELKYEPFGTAGEP